MQHLVSGRMADGSITNHGFPGAFRGRNIGARLRTQVSAVFRDVLARLPILCRRVHKSLFRKCLCRSGWDSKKFFREL